MSEYLQTELDARYDEDICSRCGTVFSCATGHWCSLRHALRARRRETFTAAPLLVAPVEHVAAERSRDR